MPSGNGNKGNISNATAQARRQQSLRDKAAAQAQSSMHQVAKMRSIPKKLQDQEDLFTKGALKSFQFAPRGQGYYDAFVQKPESAVVSSTVGPATLVTGHSSDTIVGSAMASGDYGLAAGGMGSHTGNSVLVIFNPGASDASIARAYHMVQNGSALELLEQTISCVQFQDFGPTVTSTSTLAANMDGNSAATQLDPARRVESIPLRGSLRMRNISAALEVGGLVRVMRYNGGLALNRDENGGADNPALPHVENILRICEMIRDSPRTVTYSGHDLCSVHQSNCYPADFVRSMKFETDTSWYEAIRAPAMCSILVLIDNFVSATTNRNNTYEMNFNVHRAARFTPGSLLHSMARSLKVGNHPPGEHDKKSLEPVTQGGMTVLRA